MAKYIFTLTVMAILALPTIARADFVETFDGYAIGTSDWDGSYAYRPNVSWIWESSSPNHSRIYEDDAGNPRLLPLASEAWYSRDVQIPAGAINVTMTASMSVLNRYNPDSGAVHPTWPRANHIILGNVALGITGDNISYLLWNGDPVGTINENTVTNSATILYDTRYDVKIVWHVLDGSDNDIADLYYKPQDDSEYTLIVAGLDTGADLTSKVWLAQYASDNYGVIDNVTLTSSVPEPASLCLLGVGGILVFAQRRWNACKR